MPLQLGDGELVALAAAKQPEPSITDQPMQGLLSTIAKILDSKSLLGSLGLATAAILTGNPFVVSVAVLSGSVIGLGKVAVHLAEKKLEISTREGAEVDLLVDIRTKTT